MKDQKQWLYATLALVGGIIGGALSGHLLPREAEAAAGAARVLKAEKFVLVDRSGNERGVIQVNENGAAIAFYDQKGSKRVVLGETSNGRDGLAIYGANGRQMAGFTVNEDNQSSVTLYDPANGRARVGLGVAASGEPALVLFDKNGRDRAEMHVTVNGKPGLALADEAGKTVSGLPVQGAQPPQQ
ncbi:MAG TPA: hypothetical protein VHS07_02755 [Candidatus Binataceae bacterium]|nr:hypothetical protein [Candidatus Binataceae bacterium]